MVLQSMVLHQGLEQAAFSGIDFFIYDSLHGEHNIHFAVDRAWAALWLVSLSDIKAYTA
jgi:hypothetical protein